MRSKPASIRFVAPDPIYHSVALSKLINQAMHSGKKNAIQKQVYSALEIVRSQTGQDPLPVVMEALENIKPGEQPIRFLSPFAALGKTLLPFAG